MLIDVDGVALVAERFGSGRRVLLFNGSGSSIARTRPLIEALARHCEVLVHDQRGLGLSAVPEEPPTMARFAADGAAVLDHVGWETAAIVGISFGGMVAQEFAVTFPERVDRLALLCTSSGGAGGSSYPLHTLADLEPAERASVSVQLLDTRFDAEWLASHPGDRAIVDEMTAARLRPQDPDRLRGEALQLEARRRHDVWDRLHLIDSPTLVMCGEHDGIAPPENSEAIVSRVPNSVLRRFDGGHTFIAQDRSAFPTLVEFVGGLA